MADFPTMYLGDGVYATFDGHGIGLDLRGQDDTTKIYLEPEVLAELLTFAMHNGMDFMVHLKPESS